MFGRDSGKPELFDIEESSLTYVKEQGVRSVSCSRLARALSLRCLGMYSGFYPTS